MSEMTPRPGGSELRPGLRRPRRLGERAIEGVLALCAGIAALATVGIVLILLFETVGFFTQVSVLEFFTETRWTPLFREKHFGILPLLTGSLLVGLGAGFVALPGGLLTAIFLSDLSGPRQRAILRPLLDVLAGIPTVVYGYFALTFITPILQLAIPGVGAYNAASASLVLGIMVFPTVASLSDDALRSVPPRLREAAYGLGATRMEVITRVVVPGGISGVLASFFLGLSRAFGETMVVSMAAGNSPRLTLNPLDAVQTMAAYILQAGQGNITPGTLDYRTLFAVGMVLFLVTMSLNLTSRWVLARGREGYS
ncbi:MAG: phosphate ABC transporter permease subunit PstC [Longimicrobiales bacterium]